MAATETNTINALCEPVGKITAANVDNFRRELLELVEAGATNITINLNKVDIIDSKGLAVFVVCHKTLAERGGKLTVLSDNEDFRNLFHVMRLDERFVVKASD